MWNGTGRDLVQVDDVKWYGGRLGTGRWCGMVWGGD